MGGVNASEHLSFARLGKASRGKPRRKPESRNSTFRDCRGASVNVVMVGSEPASQSKERGRYPPTYNWRDRALSRPSPESVSGSGCNSPGRLGPRVKLPGPTLQGFVVQPLLSQRSSWLCARAKAVESMQQEGRKSLRPKLAIAKVIGSASTLNRRWPKKARRHDSREKVLDRAEPEDATTNGLWLDLREEEAHRLQRFQTLALPLPLSGWLPGLDTGCCRLPGSRRPVSVTRNSWSAES